MDYDKLAKAVTQQSIFLDNVIGNEQLPSKQVESMTLANRKIGLGVMGFADLLLQLRCLIIRTRVIKLERE